MKGETIQKTHEAVESVLQQLEANVDDWEDFYPLIADGWGKVKLFVAEPEATIKDTQKFMSSLIAVAVISGYFDFRISQPRMTDFELAKRLIFQHTRNIMHNVYLKASHFDER